MTTTLTRRNFLKTTAGVAGGLIIGFHLPTMGRNAYADSDIADPAHEINAWLKIGIDDQVTVIIAHSEMGQGVYTALPMLVAEELEADWQKIQVEVAPPAAIYKNPVFGIQATGGSTTIRARWDGLRLAGAQAREMLIQAAADRWQVELGDCYAENNAVIHQPTGQKLSYGSLAEAASAVITSKKPQLKSPEAFKIIGQPLKRLDTPIKVQGNAIYGIDVKVPNMMIATLRQAPVSGGEVARYDAEAAKAMPGVKAVVDVPNGVAVVADTYWHAKKGLDALNLEFAPTDFDAVSSETLFQAFKKDLEEGEGAIATEKGAPAEQLLKASEIVEAEYYAPYVAHVTMEPQTCTASVTTDRCILWAPTQSQEIAQKLAADLTGLPLDQVEVHTTFLGGGFGRRFEMDFIKQAVLIAKAVDHPVKLIWSREEDMQHDMYRPATLAKFTAGLDAKGNPQVFKARVVNSSILSRLMPQRLQGKLDPVAMEGISELGYEIPHQFSDYVMHNTHIPVGFWRSVGHSYSGFFVESFIDELAYAAKQDPYQFRRKLLSEDSPYRRVLDMVAEKANWNTSLPEGRFRGIAVHKSFKSFVAEVAEISVEDKAVKVHKITCVVDCGIAVNPDTVKVQMESGIIYGLGTLQEAITIKNGAVEQDNFHNFPILTLIQSPEVEVHIVPSQADPTGTGEPGTPPSMPAVTNAIFAATGQRIRSLPMSEFQLV